jgi:hypothetical protein
MYSTGISLQRLRKAMKRFSHGTKAGRSSCVLVPWTAVDCTFWGSHSGSHECSHLLGYRRFGERVTSNFGVENRPRMKPSHLLHACFLLRLFPTLKTEATASSETTAHIWTTWRYIPEDDNITDVSEEQTWKWQRRTSHDPFININEVHQYATILIFSSYTTCFGFMQPSSGGFLFLHYMFRLHAAIQDTRYHMTQQICSSNSQYLGIPVSRGTGSPDIDGIDILQDWNLWGGGRLSTFGFHKMAHNWWPLE